MSLSDRLWAKVSRPSEAECWQWMAAKNRHGYGIINSGGHTGRALLAHRVAYLLTNGDVPEGMELDHLCRVRSCVNPAHLEPVTHKENLNRSDASMHPEAVRRRSLRICPSGHPYDAENTYIRANGWRACRECQRVRRRREAPNG